MKNFFFTICVAVLLFTSVSCFHQNVIAASSALRVVDLNNNLIGLLHGHYDYNNPSLQLYNTTLEKFFILGTDDGLIRDITSVPAFHIYCTTPIENIGGHHFCSPPYYVEPPFANRVFPVRSDVYPYPLFSGQITTPTAGTITGYGNSFRAGKLVVDQGCAPEFTMPCYRSFVPLVPVTLPFPYPVAVPVKIK